MHEHRLSGLPVVDERYRVVGYINLLGLLTVCLEEERSEKEAAANIEMTL
jgi:CBS-domain-containing membrane protein